MRWRGILQETTPGLADRLATGRPIAGYIGFDPSADSLHVGHLVPIFGLLRLQRFGGRPVAVMGGGTGMIGDPSGRSSERNLLDGPTLEANVASIRGQLERFLDFTPGSQGAVMVNNLDWLGEWSLIDFLRDVGKHFTIPYMLAKDSVQARLERGLSFTEFSYMLLQADDFAHLHRTMGVELQMGGADQWGNITAGLELIRRTNAAEGASEDQEPAHGLAYKLLLSPSGTKFGKSETGESVWLDAETDVALRLLPVLAEHRRSRCRDVSALVHRVPAGTDRGARERGRARARGAGRRSGHWRWTSRPGPTGTRQRRGPWPIPRRSSRARRSTIRRSCARCTNRQAGSRSIRRGSQRGPRSCWRRPGWSPRRVRLGG